MDTLTAKHLIESFLAIAVFLMVFSLVAAAFVGRE